MFYLQIRHLVPHAYLWRHCVCVTSMTVLAPDCMLPSKLRRH